MALSWPDTVIVCALFSMRAVVLLNGVAMLELESVNEL